jgi:hypothetical protein
MTALQPHVHQPLALQMFLLKLCFLFGLTPNWLVTNPRQASILENTPCLAAPFPEMEHRKDILHARLIFI